MPVKKKSKTPSKKPKSGRKQAASTASAEPPDQDSGQDREFPPTVRFSATIYAREREQADPDLVERLNVDRVPDSTGLIRALLTPADCVRLVNQGLEVHLHRAYPVQPLNPALIESDDSFKNWLDKRVQTVKSAKRRKGSKGA